MQLNTTLLSPAEQNTYALKENIRNYYKELKNENLKFRHSTLVDLVRKRYPYSEKTINRALTYEWEEKMALKYSK